jgi:hypothetical protein
MRLMIQRVFVLAVALLCGWLLTFEAHASEAPTQWLPEQGDFLVVDTRENMGYLMRSDLSEGVSFPVATGVQRNLSHGGKPYYAATPTGQWRVKALDYQAPGYTFGSEGTFLRLYDEDGQSTHYGIHTILDQNWLLMGERYKSWGCVLVTNEVLSLLETEYRLNKKQGLRVITLDDMSVFPLKRVQRLVPLQG